MWFLVCLLVPAKTRLRFFNRVCHTQIKKHSEKCKNGLKEPAQADEWLLVKERSNPWHCLSPHQATTEQLLLLLGSGRHLVWKLSEIYLIKGGDGWMASLTQWTWVWANSGRWWRTRKPGVLVCGVAKSQTPTGHLNNNNLSYLGF